MLFKKFVTSSNKFRKKKKNRKRVRQGRERERKQARNKRERKNCLQPNILIYIIRVFRTLSNIYDAAFWKKNCGSNCFRKIIHLRFSTGFSIHLCVCVYVCVYVCVCVCVCVCEYLKGNNFHEKMFKLFFKFSRKLTLAKKPTVNILRELHLVNFTRTTIFSYAIKKSCL